MGLRRSRSTQGHHLASLYFAASGCLALRQRVGPHRIMRVFSDFSPKSRPLSLDEAFPEMTGSEQLFGNPESIGRRLKGAVREATGGLTASVGLSATKYVAKVASACQKPDGLTAVSSREVKAWLAPLPVSWLWAAGLRRKHVFNRSV